MELFMVIILVLLFAFILFLFIRKNRLDRQLLETVTSVHRGTWSERNMILKLLKNNIHQKAIFHDLYLEKTPGKFSQIDIVVATKVGLIVFEVKDYSGWIFGKGTQRNWTQVLSYGRIRLPFYNPIMQNKSHIEALRKKSNQFKNIPIYSVIVFYGNCQLRDVSIIPENTFIVYPGGILKVLNLITEQNELANYTDKYEIINVLQQAVYNGDNPEIQYKHAENIRNMRGINRVFS